ASDVRSFRSLTAQPDTGFSGDGSVAIPYITPGGGTAHDASFRPLVITPGEGVLISGLIRAKVGGTQHQEFIKMNVDGTPDTAFGVNGVLDTGNVGTFDLTGQFTSTAFYLIKFDFGTNQTTIQRFALDGTTLDTTFGTNGTLTINSQATVKVLEDGKIL